MAVPAAIAAGRILWDAVRVGDRRGQRSGDPGAAAVLVGVAAVLAALLFSVIPARQATPASSPPRCCARSDRGQRDLAGVELGAAAVEDVAARRGDALGPHPVALGTGMEAVG